MNKKWFVVINPTSGNGYVKRKKDKIIKALQNLNDGFELHFTKYAKHEIDLVHQAIENNFTKIISVGGDGTLHHIINGVFTQKDVNPKEIQIGVIPVGTGNDWVKQYQIPTNISKNIAILNKGKLVRQDIGVLKANKQKVYFNNNAGLGLDAFVVKNLNKKLGKLSYIFASFKSVFSFKKSKLKITLNRQEFLVNSLLVTFGICRFSGGGMQFTTKVNPIDGLMDITVVKDLHPLALFLNIHRLYNGKLNRHKSVKTYKTKEIIIDSVSGDYPFVQADGELVGKGKIQVSILPKAINFVIP